jgi:AAA15 family ATPase/GTPase
MLTGLMSHRSKTLIVDEIDSGLHVSVMEDFWDSLIKLSRDQGIQIFCTTHSEEMLRTASSAFAGDPSMLNVIRIDSSEGGVSAQSYDFDSLNLSMKANLDVR